MKVHITLVGGQPAPICYGIVASNPDLVVYICSDKTRKDAKRLSEMLTYKSEFLMFDPVDLNNIENNCRKCLTKYGNHELTINLSGGTKPWSLYFYRFFQLLPNATFFYIDQNNTLWNLTDKTSRKIPFDIDVLLMIYGNRLSNFRSFSDYTEEDDAVAKKMESFRQLCFKGNVLRDLNEVTALLDKDKQEKLKTAADGLFVNSGNTAKASWNANGCVKIEIQNDEESFVEEFQSQHVLDIVFNSGWYEYKVAKMLSTCDEIKEIRMNCTFPKRKLEENEQALDYVKNEIDIIAATESKLIFVECKAGNFHSTDIDKFSAAVDVYGGKGSKKLFVFGGKCDEIQKEKFNDLRIDFFAASKGEKALQTLIKKNLSSINA